MFNKFIYFIFLFEFLIQCVGLDLYDLLTGGQFYRRGLSSVGSQKKKGKKDPHFQLKKYFKKLEREEIYNPHFGYEPYWPGGEWVYATTTVKLASGETTTKQPFFCGEECHYLYQSVGPVCVWRQMDMEREYPGCQWNCRGDKMDHYKTVETFESYCAFLKVQCADKRNWTLIHPGECKPWIEDILRPMDEVNKTLYLIERAKKFLTTLQERDLIY